MPTRTIQPLGSNACTASIGRRFVVSGAVASAAGLAMNPAYADRSATKPVDIAVSEGGFRYIADPTSPFSSGVAALPGNALIRVQLRKPLPLEQGLDLVTQYLTDAGRQPAALAGLELRSPSIMSRAEFNIFNQRYLSAVRSRSFFAGQTVPIARSNIVPLYDPPGTHIVRAFTYAAPRNARDAAGDAAFLLSGRPEQAGKHVMAPGDVSPGGMRQKASFVIDQLRQAVATLGGSWADLTGMQIYMTQPVSSIVEVLREAGLSNLGPQFFVASPPVIGIDGFSYEFEADMRAIGSERVI